MRVMIAVLIVSLLAPLALADTTEGPRPPASTPYSYVPDQVRNPTNVAIFRDDLPWGSMADDDVLINNGIAFTVFTSADISLVDLSAFDKVIISNQQALFFNQMVADYAGWFEAYVEAGGCLQLGMAHYFGDLPLNTAWPGGYMLTAESGNNFLTINAAAHPVLTAPNPVTLGDLEGWNYASHGDINDPAGSLSIISNNEFTFGTCLSEMPYGLGYITATSQPYNWVGAGNPFAENLVLYSPCGGVATETQTWGAVKSLFK